MYYSPSADVANVCDSVFSSTVCGDVISGDPAPSSSTALGDAISMGSARSGSSTGIAATLSTRERLVKIASLGRDVKVPRLSL